MNTVLSFGTKLRLCKNCYRSIVSPLKKGTYNQTINPKNYPNYDILFSRYQIRFCTTASTDHPTIKTTIDQDELDRFTKLANQWWDEKGEYYALHSMNRLRVPLIRDALVDNNDDLLPLRSKCILDVGCGGGILTEPLARLGAKVTGIDMVEENVQVAKTHLSQDADIKNRVTYLHSAVEDLIDTHDGQFDAVVMSEVVEHVSDLDMFISSCSKVLKPEGSMLITTLNKTYLSYGLAVFGAEQLLRIVPPGTHDWNKFVAPEDLQIHLERNGLTVQLVHGMLYNPIINKWSWISDTSINYAVHAVKTTQSHSESDNSLHSKNVIEQTDY